MYKKIIFFLFLISSVNIFAEKLEVKGTVNENGNVPLIGVSVAVEGTSVGTVTDIDGNFSFKIDETHLGSQLVFSYIGYKPIKKELSKENLTFNIILIEDATDLEEVVVVGYGKQRKGDLTVSISTVKADELATANVTSIDQGLQGQAAGVVVTQSSGKPGSPVSIRIRGTTSIMGKNEPLYVVDGIPIISESGDLTTGTIQGSEINPLSSINPSDIESLQILKDASATAIYGARGANGVIIITTKRGKKGTTNISFSSNFGIQEVTKTLDLLNARELAELGNDAVREARKYSTKEIPFETIYSLPERFTESTDWQNELFRTSYMNSYQFALRGGTEKTLYSVSANYLKQEGIIHNSDFEKYGLRANLDNQINKSVKIGLNTNFSRSINNGVITGIPNVNSSVVAQALLFNPAQSPIDETHSSGYTYKSNTPAIIPNPVAEINLTKREQISNRIITDAYLDWEIIKDLTFKAKFGIDGFYTKERQYIPNDVYRGQEKGKASHVGVDGYTWIGETTLSYLKDFDKHHFNAVIGGTMQEFTSEFAEIALERFDDNRLTYYDLSLGQDKTILSAYRNWAMISYLSRLTYDYNKKYYLTFSGRIDGSSKFGTNYKYGFFPSMSFAWRIKDEPFLKNIKSINDLKFRLGYGKVGNEGLPSGASSSSMGNNKYFFGETSASVGAYVKALKSEDLKWEKTDTYNLGVDLALFDSRITIASEVYIKKTSDLLLYKEVNGSSGYKNFWDNVGDIENRGFEFSINTVNITEPFNWSTSFNISFNKNEVTSLAGQEILGHTILGINDWTKLTEGQPVGIIYGYKTDGIAQLDENVSNIPHFPTKTLRHGDRKYVDKNGDNKINKDDYYELGNANPDFTYGMRNSFSYKNISLSIYLQGVYGNEIANFNRFSLESFDGKNNNSKAALDRWTESNPTNKYPRANAASSSFVMSDAIVEDGSYLRIKEITLGYTLPKNISNAININNIKLSVTASNIYTFTDYSGFDPEVSIYGGSVLGKGADYGAYPMSKSFIFGLSVDF
jgi:TonB-linked SusC/RagA family outer membrane protein